MDLTDKIIGISFGIRYSRSFRIPDISGDIVDDIVYGKNSPFKDLYKRMQESPNREKILSSPLNEYLRINTDDLILGVKVRNDFPAKYDWLTQKVIPYLEELFTKYHIKNIHRVGVIFHHKVSKTKKMQEAVSLLTNNSVDDTENISFTFAKKLATWEGMIRKGVTDYRNTIYMFNELPRGMLADIDYQHYYRPILEDLRQCNAKKIVDAAKSFLVDYYYPWLAEYGTTDRH